MNDKPGVLFINQVTGYLFIDIINAFAEDTHCLLFTGQIDAGHVTLNKSIKKKCFIRYNRNKVVIIIMGEVKKRMLSERRKSHTGFSKFRYIHIAIK